MNGRKPNLILSLMGCVLILGLLAFLSSTLINFRFESGDVYAPYSSFRTDPLGTKAFYESLQPFGQVSRNLRTLDHLRGTTPFTLFILGIQPEALIERNAPNESIDLNTLLNQGSHLVICTTLTTEKEIDEEEEKKEEVKEEPAQSNKPKEQNKGKSKKDTFNNHYGFELDFDATVLDPKGNLPPISAVKKADHKELPDSIPWHSTLYFKNLDPAWNVLYTHNNHPVIMERTWSRGKILVAGDSYLFSNEAMFKDRFPTLLSYLSGNTSSFIFDETHLGVFENPGIMSLMRKYHLMGSLWVLLLLLLLLVWKYSSPLIPPHETLILRDVIKTDSDAETGFLQLLKKNIPASRILEVCILESEKSRKKTSQENLENKWKQIRRILEEEKQKTSHPSKPVEIYNRIQNLLHEGKHHGKHKHS